jgi:hypothetical protein
MDLEGVREALHREPFKPFEICLADGRRLPIPHPDFVAVGKRRIIVIQPDDSSLMIEPLLIVSLDCNGKHPAKKNHRKKETG